jgi:hypothetical protein
MFVTLLGVISGSTEPFTMQLFTIVITELSIIT